MVVGNQVSDAVAAYRPGHRWGYRMLTVFVSLIFGREMKKCSRVTGCFRGALPSPFRPMRGASKAKPNWRACAGVTDAIGRGAHGQWRSVRGLGQQARHLL
jgi:hypothetical protein